MPSYDWTIKTFIGTPGGQHLDEFHWCSQRAVILAKISHSGEFLEIAGVVAQDILGSLHPFFFFNDTPTTEIYTLSLHDALPIYRRLARNTSPPPPASSLTRCLRTPRGKLEDRKRTRLNSSHDQNSYAAFCLKKKNKATVLAKRMNNRQGLISSGRFYL